LTTKTAHTPLSNSVTRHNTLVSVYIYQYICTYIYGPDRAKLTARTQSFHAGPSLRTQCEDELFAQRGVKFSTDKGIAGCYHKLSIEPSPGIIKEVMKWYWEFTTRSTITIVYYNISDLGNKIGVKVRTVRFKMSLLPLARESNARSYKHLISYFDKFSDLVFDKLNICDYLINFIHNIL
jgi:hypothetical protein